jgi:uncharacterized membrane protein
MIRGLKVLGGLTTVLYPVLVLWVLSTHRDYLQVISAIAIPVLAVAGGLVWLRSRQLKRIISHLAAIALLSAVACTDTPDFFKLYPLMVSGVLLTQFGNSLLNPPTIIERFASLAQRGAALPPDVVKYCRKVTWVWVGFFIFNISVSGLTALVDNWELWTLYNGLISYILIGILMGGEWLVRRHVQKKVK